MEINYPDKNNNTIYKSYDNITFKSRGRKLPDGFYFITVILEVQQRFNILKDKHLWM